MDDDELWGAVPGMSRDVAPQGSESDRSEGERSGRNRAGRWKLPSVRWSRASRKLLHQLRRLRACLRMRSEEVMEYMLGGGSGADRSSIGRTTRRDLGEVARVLHVVMVIITYKCTCSDRRSRV